MSTAPGGCAPQGHTRHKALQRHVRLFAKRCGICTLCYHALQQQGRDVHYSTTLA